MRTIQLWVRAVLVCVVVADLLAFSMTTYSTLIFMGMGTAMVLIGLAYSYRPASALGFVVVAAVAAGSMEFISLTTVGAILTAFIGLLLPVMLLAWLALSAEEEGAIDFPLVRRPAAMTVLFAVLCLFSISIFVLTLSLMFPTMSMNITTITEATVMLFTGSFIGLVLLGRNPRPRPAPAGPEGE